jgi:hypothetical protein
MLDDTCVASAVGAPAQKVLQEWAGELPSVRLLLHFILGLERLDVAICRQ